MFQLQILAVLLSVVLVYFLLRGFSFNRFADNICFGSRVVHHVTSKQTSCEHSKHCCGNIGINLKCPFRFKGDHVCSGPDFELSCKHNRTILHLKTYRQKDHYFYVEQDSIDYGTETFRVIDPGVQKNNCSTLPLFSFPTLHYDPFLYIDSENTDVLIYMSCKNPVNSKSALYVDTSSCNITANHFFNNQNFSFESSSNYSYVVVGKNLSPSDIEESCTIFKMFPAQILPLPSITTTNISYQDIHNLLAEGFQLLWSSLPPMNSFFCRLYFQVYYRGRKSAHIELAVGSGVKFFILVIAARNVIGVILLSAFLIYKWHRRHLSMYDAVEEFLQTNHGLMPIRYSYKELKAMTNNFRVKLGEGGYGLVYKGKLRSGNLVAVKMLNKSKANGQEFINEVATIGRIHHVNVVRLVGFCATVSKRALVYDYMPKGSLDKYIFSGCSNCDLMNWTRSYDIATGVARGIEYLHQGCNMQILHFDIKPHNILLDENFVPKISDFGLAKLYPAQNSVVTLTTIRGTLGYMAPELLYQKIGKVSCKADIYSFGKLLMEMAGRRRNVNAEAEHSSQIYYPFWIYDKFDKGEELEIEDITEEEKGIAKKLILIGLWCIQMTPADRPSMREVLKMLEGDLEALELPPKPMFYPSNSPALSERSYHSSSGESTEPLFNSIPLEIE